MVKKKSNDFNLLTEVPIINNRKELKEWLRPVYILSEEMKDDTSYNIFQQKLSNILKGCFVIRECREYPIKFKFYPKDKKTYTMEFRHFIINLIVWYPFVELNDLQVLNEDFILDCKNDIPTIENYINNKLILTLRDYHIKPTRINFVISEVLYNLRKISEDYSIILGLNFSAPMFVDLYNTIPEMKEMMECKFDESMQPHEIERKLQEYEDKEIELLKSQPNNPLGVVLRANTGIKHRIICAKIKKFIGTNLLNCWELSLRQSAAKNLHKINVQRLSKVINKRVEYIQVNGKSKLQLWMII